MKDWKSHGHSLSGQKVWKPTHYIRNPLNYIRQNKLIILCEQLIQKARSETETIYIIIVVAMFHSPSKFQRHNTGTRTVPSRIYSI